MTSSFFDAGDLERLDREARLTDEAPRNLPEEDRSPIEEPIPDEPENNVTILARIMELLARRLK